MRALWLGALIASLAGVATRGWAAGVVEEVVSCVRANLPKGDELRAITLVSRDRAGREQVMQASVFANKTPTGDQRLLLVLSQPEVLRDSSILILRNPSSERFWLHTPQVDRRELTGMARQEGLLGTDLSVDDLLQLESVVGVSTKQLTRLADSEVDGRAVYQVESRPPLDSSPYVRVVTSIDREWCVPLRSEFYEVGDAKPRKLLVIESLEGMSHNTIPLTNVMIQRMGEKTGAWTTVFSNDLSNLRYPKVKEFDAIFLNSIVGEFAPEIFTPFRCHW